MQTIPAWSFSALSTFEQCPYRSKLAKIDKIPEPQRPPPVKGKEHANDRGSRIHDNAEDFVRGKAHLSSELYEFRDELTRLKEYFNEGKVVLEDMWCFDNAWTPVGPKDWENIWVRIKLDALVFLSDTEALVIDYKTGRKYGNEVKHGQQCQLYQLAAFLRYPELEYVHTELWYPDVKELTHVGYTRKQGLRYLRGFNERGIEMTSTTHFEPRPNHNSCMFCPYSPEEYSNKWVNKNGACEFGVK